MLLRRVAVQGRVEFVRGCLWQLPIPYLFLVGEREKCAVWLNPRPFPRSVSGGLTCGGAWRRRLFSVESCMMVVAVLLVRVCPCVSLGRSLVTLDSNGSQLAPDPTYYGSS